MFSRKAVSLFLALMLLVLPLSIAHAAGGTITGTVTDPKGAVVVGAAVSVIDPASNQTFTGTTDAQGRYKIEGLPAGTYVVTVSAKGFTNFRNEKVVVADNQTASLSIKLEVAALQEVVTVNASGAKANADPLYQQLRQKTNAGDSFNGPFATINNLALKRDAATLMLRSGEIYFPAPTEGRYTGAVFIGEGEITLTPPTEIEKKSLTIFTETSSLTEQFTQLVLHFTDKTFDEIKASPNVTMGTNGAQAVKAREAFRSNQSLLRRQFRSNIEIRTLMDIYSPQRPGFFVAFINGKRYNKLAYQVDPQGISDLPPDEVALSSYGESDGGIWTSFHLENEYRTNRANSGQDHRIYDITKHDLDVNIRGTQIAASDQVTFVALSTRRVLPFNLFRSLRVSSVQDEQGKDLDFIQESKDEDADFAIVMPQPLNIGKTYKVTIQYQGGEALKDLGGGNFFLVPRETWYPNNPAAAFGDRSFFDMTFRYPKGHTLIATGHLASPETQEESVTVAKWTGGADLAVAGFNYGKFKKKETTDEVTGYNVEIFTNTQIAPDLKARNDQIRMLENESGESIEQMSGGQFTSTSGSTSQGAAGALADTQNAMRVYDEYFGKLSYKRLAMSQQPAGDFGQAWPTLVYMPYTAFLDSTTRKQLMGSRGATDTFWRYVGPHEISHQWWGNTVGWSSYHDQWMSEGFSEFAASLYVQHILKSIPKFIDYWENQRKQIIEATPATKGRKPYTVGPLSLGGRLSSAKTGAAYQMLIYPKGAFVLHMLRMMMYDRNGKDSDARFKVMMKEFVQTYYNKEATTDDFKRVVEKHITRDMDLTDNQRMDWFFDQWVHDTEMPAYKFEYQVGSANGKATVSGRITQSGVSDNFRMLIPVYVDFGKGWQRLGSATIVGNSSVELPNIPMPQAPKKVAILALHDVLYSSIENIKR